MLWPHDLGQEEIAPDRFRQDTPNLQPLLMLNEQVGRRRDGEAQWPQRFQCGLVCKKLHPRGLRRQTPAEKSGASEGIRIHPGPPATFRRN
jgi:hypothetical protein